jgi:hypothetical protein
MTAKKQSVGINITTTPERRKEVFSIENYSIPLYSLDE